MRYRQQVIDDLTALDERLIKDISKKDLQVFVKVVEKMMDNLSD